MKNYWIRTVILCFGLVGVAVGQARAADDVRVSPLLQAHAHNDYAHQRPLLDALQYGFCSVEADIFLVKGELLVGHTQLELNPQRTLQALYLDPLRRRVQRNAGRVYRGGPPLTLLIDIKTDGQTTFAVLQKVLQEYDDILSHVAGETRQTKAVSVVISGNRAWDSIAAPRKRWAAIDGRLSDLQKELPNALVPLISDNWRNHFRWRGAGTMPAAERQRLQDFVAQAHKQGRRVRFWATPENPAVWAELLEAHVDLIGTDDLPALQKFLLQRTKKQK